MSGEQRGEKTGTQERAVRHHVARRGERCTKSTGMRFQAPRIVCPPSRNDAGLQTWIHRYGRRLEIRTIRTIRTLAQDSHRWVGTLPGAGNRFRISNGSCRPAKLFAQPQIRRTVARDDRLKFALGPGESLIAVIALGLAVVAESLVALPFGVRGSPSADAASSWLRPYRASPTSSWPP